MYVGINVIIYKIYRIYTAIDTIILTVEDQSHRSSASTFRGFNVRIIALKIDRVAHRNISTLEGGIIAEGCRSAGEDETEYSHKLYYGSAKRCLRPLSFFENL